MKHSARGQTNTLVFQVELAEHGILRNNDKVLAYTLLLDELEIFHQLDNLAALAFAAAHKLYEVLSEHYAAAAIHKDSEQLVMLVE